VAAAQPVLRSETVQKQRTDAAAFFVIDTSRSMAASAGPDARTRFQHEQSAALELRDALPEIPVGVATFTDRILPETFPSASRTDFAGVVDRSLAVDQPPPRLGHVVATTFDALVALPRQNYFAPAAKHRLVVLLTDGESAGFDPPAVGRAFERAAIRLVVVRIGGAGDRIYRPDGTIEARYRPERTAPRRVADLVAATGGQSFAEDDLDAAAKAARRALGHGPVVVRGRDVHEQALGLWLALAALAPLAFLLWRRHLR
jgi:hypothetical protein